MLTCQNKINIIFERHEFLNGCTNWFFKLFLVVFVQFVVLLSINLRGDRIIML